MDPDEIDDEISNVNIDDVNIVGINLVSDSDQNVHTCLGVIQLSSTHVTLEALRQTLATQLCALPANYRFITKQGWPVASLQEKTLKCSHVISDSDTLCIQTVYDMPRVGIKAKSGISLGFVFVDYKYDVSQLRDILEQQLPFFGGLRENYQFLDMNGWPISRVQEAGLSVLNIMVSQCIWVCTDVSMRAAIESHGSAGWWNNLAGPANKKMKSLRELSFRSSKDQDRRQSNDSGSTDQGEAKQILISYARADAAKNAMDLKNELTGLGFGVFLDVLEIKTGVDWQDSLNYAVTNCEIFIPLITPRYGHTQWTNREVKLADVLGKYILPVSFLEEWPPRCLAIQFATTQFIQWKLQIQIDKESSQGDGDKARDIRHWDPDSVRYVALEIADRVKNYRESNNNNNKKVLLVRQQSMLRSYPSTLPATCEGINDLMMDRQGKSLVVICLHPAQTEFGSKLSKQLEHEDYEVWCSTSIDFGEEEPLSLSQDAIISPGSQSCQSTDTTDSVLNGRRLFQEKANDAGVVIVLLSQEFAQSKTCQQQVFYCEHRKRVIPLMYRSFQMPGWLSMLIGTSPIEEVNNDQFSENVMSRVKNSLDPYRRENPMEDHNEARLISFTKQIWQSVTPETCVYISGGATFFSNTSEDICRCIGMNLAQMDDISIVTGGFFGVGESVGRSFYEETQRIWKKHKVWHILPLRDSINQTKRALQNEDGSFRALAYGKTLFCGNSVRERESIVARAFDICILIEGGPGAAHEAEQFSWSDHIVIPIKCTGGAANGKFGVPQKIFEVPQFVQESDWSVLDHSKASPDMIGRAVRNIVSSLQSRQTQALPIKAVVPKIPAKAPLSRVKRSSSSMEVKKPSLTSMKTMILG